MTVVEGLVKLSFRWPMMVLRLRQEQVKRKKDLKTKQRSIRRTIVARAKAAAKALPKCKAWPKAKARAPKVIVAVANQHVAAAAGRPRAIATPARKPCEVTWSGGATEGPLRDL